MHKGGKRSFNSAPPELVNNSAAELVHKPAARHNSDGRFPATRATGPFWTSPSRVRRRSPSPAPADAQKVERTSSLEGSCISSPASRLAKPVRAARVMNTDWTQHK